MQFIDRDMSTFSIGDKNEGFQTEVEPGGTMYDRYSILLFINSMVVVIVVWNVVEGRRPLSTNKSKFINNSQFYKRLCFSSQVAHRIMKSPATPKWEIFRWS